MDCDAGRCPEEIIFQNVVASKICGDPLRLSTEQSEDSLSAAVAAAAPLDPPLIT